MPFKDHHDHLRNSPELRIPSRGGYGFPKRKVMGMLLVLEDGEDSNGFVRAPKNVHIHLNRRKGM